MTPLVSICVPNLNTRPYLPERFATIFDQTFQDWELIVYDSYSDDGAWEYFQELASREPRMRISQGPKQGTPGSWTPCIRQATGKYVYIATSDDTMAPDFLEKMVSALEAHPECDLAHASLKVIGDDAAGLQRGWEEDFLFARSSGGFKNKNHIRRAPFDALLHLTGGTVYISITQLLVRRTLFDKIGYFERTWGSIGDFDWDMRAAMVANTVHVPQTWGGWRIHSTQATSGVDDRSEAHAVKIDEMIDHTIETCCPLLPPLMADKLRMDWAPFAHDMRRLLRKATAIKQVRGRWVYHLGKALLGSRAAAHHLTSRLAGGPMWPDTVPALVREWLGGVGIPEPLMLCEEPASVLGAKVERGR